MHRERFRNIVKRRGQDSTGFTRNVATFQYRRVARLINHKKRPKIRPPKDRNLSSRPEEKLNLERVYRDEDGP
jgi:hypothetical protein